MKNSLVIILLFCFAELHAQPFTQTTVVSGLHYPVAFTITPDLRFLVTLKGHNTNFTNCDSSIIKSYDWQGNYLGKFFHLDGDSNFCDGETGILGICLDADYLNNKFVYFYYNHLYGSDSSIRVVRLKDSSNTGINPTILLDIKTNYQVGEHVAGNIRTSSFHPGKIFIPIGDRVNNSYPQSLNNPFGKFLRINTDGTIPTGNPFYDDGNPASGNDDRIWSYGHRNAFDFCISSVTGTIYSSENGWNFHDEVNLIEAGKNYGWPQCEGAYLFNSASAPCNNPAFTNPLEDWPAPVPALTGVEFYTGLKIPALTNKLLAADNNNGLLYACTMGNPPAYDTVLSRTTVADLTTSGGITTLMQGPDSCLYAMRGGFTSSGAIYRLCNAASGTDEHFNSNAIELFPVPCSGELNVRADREIAVSIYDLSGRKMIEIKNYSPSHKVNIEISSGLYILHCTDKNGKTAIRKITVY